MAPRHLTIGIVALLILFSGCNGISQSESQTSDKTPPQTVTATGTTKTPGTEEATHVLVIDSKAENAVNVSISLTPQEGETTNKSFVLEPGETSAFPREVAQYRVSVVIEDAQVVENAVVKGNKQVYVSIQQNGTAETRNITV